MSQYNFTKLSVRPDVKREIDIIAASTQRPVYDVVGEMLASWKRENQIERIDVIPTPDASAKVIPVVTFSR
jgi:hypothetical protein